MRIAVTAVVAAVLGLLSSYGVYQAAQPPVKQSQAPLYDYGTSR
ncbi:hypothetical protein [Pedococcus sp. 5OH_020]|jgi:hypothetical protein|nr:hypothetical protein [Pedococcus sp. 5OH_020]